MSAQPEIRPLPFGGLSGFGIDRRGAVYRISGPRAASRTRVQALSRRAIEGSWTRHADPVGGLVSGADSSGQTETYTLASFSPEPGSDGVRRRFVVGDGIVKSNRMAMMTEQRPLPLPAGGNLDHGWYKLPGVAMMPVETGVGFGARETRGSWYFHGPSVAHQIFCGTRR
jgi:hypothetical protein